MIKAKGIELGKRAKISQAQQYMVLAVLGAAFFLGAAIAVVIKSVGKIGFSANVIVAEDQSIVAFSNTIKNIGICPRPSGEVYTDTELKNCNPNSVKASSVKDSLRSNILEKMASNAALASVPNTGNSNCTNPKTGKNYTYQELEDGYNNAKTEEDSAAAVKLIESCSSLRIIPDALPAFKNEEALLASVDQLFRDSGTLPQSLSPTDEIELAGFGNNLYSIQVRLSLESDTGTIYRLLNNLEHSIRNFNIERTTITWSSRNSVELQARASAYYMEPSTLSITEKTIKPGGK